GGRQGDFPTYFSGDTTVISLIRNWACPLPQARPFKSRRRRCPERCRSSEQFLPRTCASTLDATARTGAHANGALLLGSQHAWEHPVCSQVFRDYLPLAAFRVILIGRF